MKTITRKIETRSPSRRTFLKMATLAATSIGVGGECLNQRKCLAGEAGGQRGSQRLSVERLKQFESLRYGMFISFDIQTFVPYSLRPAKGLTDQQRSVPLSVYMPDKLDVGQWIAVARDAGMKYAVLTAKRHPEFCLWASKHTDYTVVGVASRFRATGVGSRVETGNLRAAR